MRRCCLPLAVATVVAACGGESAETRGPREGNSETRTQAHAKLVSDLQPVKASCLAGNCDALIGVCEALDAQKKAFASACVVSRDDQQDANLRDQACTDGLKALRDQQPQNALAIYPRLASTSPDRLHELYFWSTAVKDDDLKRKIASVACMGVKEPPGLDYKKSLDYSSEQISACNSLANWLAAGKGGPKDLDQALLAAQKGCAIEQGHYPERDCTSLNGFVHLHLFLEKASSSSTILQSQCDAAKAEPGDPGAQACVDLAGLRFAGVGGTPADGEPLFQKACTLDGELCAQLPAPPTPWSPQFQQVRSRLAKWLYDRKTASDVRGAWLYGAVQKDLLVGARIHQELCDTAGARGAAPACLLNAERTKDPVRRAPILERVQKLQASDLAQRTADLDARTAARKALGVARDKAAIAKEEQDRVAREASCNKR